MDTTLKAMKRVLEIREARQKRFIKNRLQPDLEKEKLRNIKEIEKNVDLIAAPLSQRRKEVARLMKTVEENREAQMEE
jgi:hypothetical protein